MMLGIHTTSIQVVLLTSPTATAASHLVSKQNIGKLSDSKFSHLSPVSLIPSINLYFRTYSRIFVKIRNGSNIVFKVMGETDKLKISCWTPFNLRYSFTV